MSLRGRERKCRRCGEPQCDVSDIGHKVCTSTTMQWCGSPCPDYLYSTIKCPFAVQILHTCPQNGTCVIALLEQRRVSSRLSHGGQLFFTLCTCTKRAEKGITAIPTILLSTGVMHSAYGSGTKLMAKPTPNKNLGHIHSLTEARLASIR